MQRLACHRLLAFLHFFSIFNCSCNVTRDPYYAPNIEEFEGHIGFGFSVHTFVTLLMHAIS